MPPSPDPVHLVALPPPDAEDGAGSVRELHHDLRQPLAAIGALVAAAEAQGDVPAPVRACLRQIGEEARQLLALCRAVLEQQSVPRAVPVGRLAAAVAGSCRAAAACPIDVAVVEASSLVDEVGLRRVIWNLLENAVRAAGTGGRVQLEVRNEAGAILLSVGDSGPGFGAGASGMASLGLEIVRRFADAHGGMVEIGKSQLGGALVTVALPAFIDLSSTSTGIERSSCPSTS